MASAFFVLCNAPRYASVWNTLPFDAQCALKMTLNFIDAQERESVRGPGDGAKKPVSDKMAASSGKPSTAALDTPSRPFGETSSKTTREPSSTSSTKKTPDRKSFVSEKKTSSWASSLSGPAAKKQKTSSSASGQSGVTAKKPAASTAKKMLIWTTRKTVLAEFAPNSEKLAELAGKLKAVTTEMRRNARVAGWDADQIMALFGNCDLCFFAFAHSVVTCSARR